MIYFIRDTQSGNVKIGFSDDPWRRFSKIQSDCPGVLEMLAALDGDRLVESALHERFAKYRLRGEWFACVGDLAMHVSGLPRPDRPANGPGQRFRWGDSGLTDDDLAPLVGVCRPQINKIRRGISVPSLPVAVKIAEVTGVTLESLMGAQPVRKVA